MIVKCPSCGGRFFRTKNHIALLKTQTCPICLERVDLKRELKNGLESPEIASIETLADHHRPR